MDVVFKIRFGRPFDVPNAQRNTLILTQRAVQFIIDESSNRNSTNVSANHFAAQYAFDTFHLIDPMVIAISNKTTANYARINCTI